MNDHTWDSSSVIDWSARTNGTGGVIAFTRGENPLRADKLNAAFAERVWRGGDTMNGFLTLAADPLVRLHAATKQYVDTRIASVIGGGGQTNTVLSFGAVGDGVTHDSTAINQAINAMASNGTLRFPATNLAGNPAVYLIDATLLVLSNSHFIIEAGATLKLIDNAPQMNVLSMNGANNVIIELYGLIDGNRLNQPGTLGTGDGNGVSCGIGGGPCNNVFIFGNNQGAVRYFKNWPVNLGTSPTPGVTSRSVEVRGIAMTDSGNSAEFSGVSHKVNVVAGSSYTASTGDIKFVTDAAHFINVGNTFCFSLAVAPSQYLQGEYVATSVPNANEVHAHVAVPTTGTGPITAGHVSIANRCYSSGFVDCYVARIPDLALVLYGGCTACYIKDCEITECNSTGPCIFSDTGQPASNEDCEISGCYVHDTYGSGVVVTSNLYGIFHKNSRVFGNTIANARVGGVQLGSSDGVEAYDNLVHNAGVTTGPAHQMGLLIIAPTAKKANVRNNTLRDPHPAILSTTQTKGQLTSYNSATGAISFQTITPGTGGGSSTVPVNHNINVGDTFAAHLPVGTGDYLALDGTWVATTGTSGSTLNFTVPPGLGFTLNRINFFQTTYATLTSHVVPGTYTSDATGIISVQTDQPHGYPVGAWFVLDGINGSAPGTGGATDYAGVILNGQQLALAGTTGTTLTFTVTPLTTVVVTNGGRVMPASFGIIISGTDETGGTLTLPGTGPDYARISGNRIGDYQSPTGMVACMGGVWGLNGAADGNYFGPRRAIDPDVSDYNKSGISGINYDLVSNTAPVNMRLTGLMTFQTNLGQSPRFLPPTGLTPAWNYHVGRGEVDFFCGQGAGGTGGFDFLQVQVLRVASSGNSYDPDTGIVTLITTDPHTIVPGGVFALSSMSGTDGVDSDDVLKLNGSHVANDDTTGTTLTFTTLHNLTIIAITGGIVTPAHTGGGLVSTSVGVNGSLLANDGLGNTRLGGALAHGAMYISPPLINGGTVTVPPNTSMVLIQNAAAIASATIVLPAAAAGQYAYGTELELNFQNPITTLSFSGAPVSNPPTTIITPGTSVNFVLSGSVWQRRTSDGNLVPVGGPFLPLIGGTLTGNLTINKTTVYDGTTSSSLADTALRISQTASGTVIGTGEVDLNSLVLTDTLTVNPPSNTIASFQAQIDGTTLSLNSTVSPPTAVPFTGSIFSNTLTIVSGAPGLAPGSTVQWSGGTDMVKIAAGPGLWTLYNTWGAIAPQAMTGLANTFSVMGSVSGSTLTVASLYGPGVITAGMQVQWNLPTPGANTIISGPTGGPYTLVNASGTIPSQPMLLMGPQPAQTVTWDSGDPDNPGTVTVGSYITGHPAQFSLLTDQGTVSSRPMQTIKAGSQRNVFGFSSYLNFGGGDGSRYGWRLNITQTAPMAGHGLYLPGYIVNRLRYPSGGTDLWAGAKGTGWAGNTVMSFEKGSSVVGDPGAVNFRGGSSWEFDYQCLAGSPDDPAYPKATTAILGGIAVIRGGQSTWEVPMWESDYALAISQQGPLIRDLLNNPVRPKAAKYGLRFGSTGGVPAIDPLHGRAIAAVYGLQSWNTDGTPGIYANQAPFGVDWIMFDYTRAPYRWQGGAILGSATPLPGALAIGGGYLSATNTTVSLDTAGSVCTGATVAPGFGGANCYLGMVCQDDVTGVQVVVTGVDGAVSPRVGTATTVVLIPRTGQSHNAEIPINPVPFRPMGNPLTFLAPGPTGPKLNLTWTAPTTLALQPSGGATVFGGHVTTPDGVNVADYFAPGRVAGTTNDLPAWNAAVAKAVAMGGATITAPTGTVSLITGAIVVNTSFVRFDLRNSVTIKMSGGTIDKAIYFQGTTSNGPIWTADIPVGATQITASDLRGTVVGQFIYLAKSSPANGGLQGAYYFIVQVRDIQGTGPFTVFLQSPVPIAFGLADAGYVSGKLGALDGVGVDGGIFDGTAVTTTTCHAVYSLSVVRSSFTNIKGLNVDTGSLLFSSHGHGNVFDNVFGTNCGNTVNGYACVEVFNNTGSQISRMRQDAPLGFGTVIAGCANCTGDGFICEGVNPAGRGFKIQASLYCTHGHIQGHYNHSNGCAIACGCVGVKLIGVSANGNITNEGLWFSDQYNTGCMVIGVDAHWNAVRDIYIGPTDTGNTIIGANAEVIVDQAPNTSWLSATNLAIAGSATAKFSLGMPGTNNVLTVTPGSTPTSGVSFSLTNPAVFQFGGSMNVSGGGLVVAGPITATASSVVGQLGLTAGTAAGAGANVSLFGAVGTSRQILFDTGSLARHAIRANTTAEPLTGTNAGTDLDFITFNDAGGALINPAMRIVRSSGHVLVNTATDDGISSLLVAGKVKGTMLAEGITNAITLTGSTQATAFAFTTGLNMVSNVPAGSGGVLPQINVAVTPGTFIDIMNTTTTAAKIYGTNPATIDGVATATGVTLSGNARCRYWALTANAWVSTLLGGPSA